ncbi:ankyrin repeats (3 copies) domain-containing protein [Sarocladium implicatum]|nr:ankyrin repeats (3 copies) domain-containing protein [Sarocladium implicatum]
MSQVPPGAGDQKCRMWLHRQSLQMSWPMQPGCEARACDWLPDTLRTKSGTLSRNLSPSKAFGRLTESRILVTVTTIVSCCCVYIARHRQSCSPCLSIFKWLSHRIELAICYSSFGLNTYLSVSPSLVLFVPWTQFVPEPGERLRNHAHATGMETSRRPYTGLIGQWYTDCHNESDEEGRIPCYVSFLPKSQWERQIKQWNRRKNLEKSEWQSLLPVYDIAVQQHGRGDVRILIAGKVVTEEKIERNRRRYCRGSGIAESGTIHVRFLGLPRAVSIEIRESGGDWRPSAHPQALGALQSDEVGIGEEDHHAAPMELPADLSTLGSALPNVETAGLYSLVPDSVLDHAQQPTALVQPPLSPVSLYMSQLNGIDTDHLPWSFSPHRTHGSLPLDSLGDTTLHDLARPTNSTSSSLLRSQTMATWFIHDLPYYRFERILKRHAGIDLTSVTAAETNNHQWLWSQKTFARFLHTVTTQNLSLDKPGIALVHHHNQRALLQPLLSLLPGEQVIFNQSEDSVDKLLPRLLMFSFANDLLGLGGIDVASVLAYLGRYRNMSHVFAQLEHVPGSYRKAVAVGLFKASIEARETPLARQLLLIGGFNLDRIFLDVNGQTFSPLERASMLFDVDMVRLLLRASIASPNQARESSHALQAMLVKLMTTVPRAVVEITKLLLGAGALVELHHLNWVLKMTRLADVAYELAAAASRDRPNELLKERSLLLSLITDLDELHSYEILTRALSGCVYMEHPDCKHRELCHELLLESAARGHITISRLFLGHARDWSEVLMAAIHGGSEDLVDVIPFDQVRHETSRRNSRAGSQLRGPDIRDAMSRWRRYSGPSAEAFRSERKRFVQRCEEYGLQHFPDGAVLLAAAHSPHEFSSIHALIDSVDPVFLLAAAEQMVHASEEELAMYWLNHWLQKGDMNDLDIISGSSFCSAALKQGCFRLTHLLLDTVGWLVPDDWSLVNPLIRCGDRSIVAKALKTHPLKLATGRPTLSHFRRFHIVKLERGMLDLLLSAEHIPQGLVQFCFRLATTWCDRELAEKMLSLGADAFDEVAIHQVTRNHPEMLAWLLEQRATSPSYLMDPLTQQKILEELPWGSKGFLSCLQALIQSGSFNLPNRCLPPQRLFWSPPLLSAIKADWCDPVEGAASVSFLLDAGANANGIVEEAPDGNKTPLLLAIQHKHLEIVETLLDHHAQVNCPATFRIRRTPLQMAAEIGRLDIVTLLLDQGADVNAEPALYAGATALQLAAASGICNIALKLLESGADLHQQPARYQGRWPLEAAAEHGNMDMIVLLWKVSGTGFSDEICDRAVELATKNGREPCADLIGELRDGSYERAGWEEAAMDTLFSADAALESF